MVSADVFLAGIFLLLMMATSTFDIFLSVRIQDRVTVRLCQVLAVLFGLAVFCCCCVRGRFFIKRMPFNVPLLAFLLTSAVSTVNSAFPARSIPYFLWTIFNAVFFIYAVVAFINLHPGAGRFALRCYVIAGLVPAAFGIVQFTIGTLGLGAPLVQQWVIDDVIPRVNAFSYEPSYAALYLLTSACLTGLLARDQVWLGLPMRFLFALTCVVIVLTFSRSGWIALVLFLLFWLFIGERAAKKLQVRTVAIVLIACTAVVALFWEHVSFFGARWLEPAGYEASISPRINRLFDTAEIFVNNPLLGVGPGAIGGVIWATPGFEVRYEEDSPWRTEGAGQAFEMLASGGVIGFLSWAWLVISVVRLCLLLARDCEDRAARSMLQALAWAFVFTVGLLQANQNFLRPPLWIHMGVCMGWYVFVNNSRRPQLEIAADASADQSARHLRLESDATAI
jgi:O-antigen ligase